MSDYNSDNHDNDIDFGHVTAEDDKRDREVVVVDTRRRSIKRIAALLLVIAIISTVTVLGTLSKYTTTVDLPTSTAIVAKFTPLDPIASFDLFSVVGDTNGANYANPPVADTDIASSVSPNPAIIAPGSWGKAEFTVSDASQVTVNVAVTFMETNDDHIPIEYSADGVTWGDISELDVPTTAVTSGGSTYEVYWRWPFESGDDMGDTTLGLAGTATVTITGTATFTQVD
ncbi:MAG: hypothetical protein LBN02_09390 [Oscillospiraceae bacterium]|jgi:hypothetical protein|nr:hypothetical protein [Oscillospiraceae bacterium]